MSNFLTVAEIADHLRIRPRKVYALVAAGEIPHRRAGARLIFDRQEIESWLRGQGSAQETPRARPPAMIAGSHDPLLEWAVRASGATLALMTRGSRDGLEQMVAGEACAAALHFPQPAGAPADQGGAGNAAQATLVGAERPWVLIAWARRTQGLVVAPGNPLAIHGMADLARTAALRIGRRQSGAGSRELFDQLVSDADLGASLSEAGFVDGLTSEDEVGLAVREGRIDCGLAIEVAARRNGLDFVPLVDERLDLLIDRGSYFEAPLQSLFGFTHSAEFRDRAAALPGYSVAELGTVRWNSAAN